MAKPTKKAIKPTPRKPPAKKAQTEPRAKRSAVPKSLDALATSLPTPSPELRDVLLAHLTEDELVQRGVRVDSAVLVREALPFAATLAAVPAEAKKVRGWSHEATGLLVAETLTLRELKSAFDARGREGRIQLSARREAYKQSASKAIAERDQAYLLLKAVLPSDRHGDVESAVGTAESWEKLSEGLDGLAALVEATLDAVSAARTKVLAQLGLDEGLAQSLKKHAAKVRDTGRAAEATTADGRVSQRALDRQDGIVVHLLGLAYRAFREARTAGKTTIAPPLGALRPQFEQVSGSKPEPAPAPVPAA